MCIISINLINLSTYTLGTFNNTKTINSSFDLNALKLKKKNNFERIVLI